MANDVNSNQPELSEVQKGAQNTDFRDIAATIWAAPSPLERGPTAALPVEFPTVSFNYGAESETAPNDLEIRRSVTNSDTAPDKPNDDEIGHSATKGRPLPDLPSKDTLKAFIPGKHYYRHFGASSSDSHLKLPNLKRF